MFAGLDLKHSSQGLESAVSNSCDNFSHPKFYLGFLLCLYALGVIDYFFMLSVCLYRMGETVKQISRTILTGLKQDSSISNLPRPWHIYAVLQIVIRWICKLKRRKTVEEYY